jgi:outer membrane receptor protein involved in Fe transport
MTWGAATVASAADPADASAESAEGSLLSNSGDLDEVLVYGRGEKRIGTASAASEGAIAGADLSVRPLLRVAELLEAVPGLIAAQHSGSGKANQYFLRGFNLDHGTDFTTYVDDMPWNFRTHGHGQGYLDVNGLIPEIVNRIDYRKGTYYADTGDFSMAGSSFISTVNRFDHPWVGVEAGQYGWRRAAAGGSVDVGGGTLTGAGQWKTYNGPWQQPESLEHESLWGKYVHDTGLGAFSATLSGYHAFWRPTEQSPDRAIGTSVCPTEFCSLDPTATGQTMRWIATVHLQGTDWRATAYAQYYDWDMFSNPTYDYQLHQFDRRWTSGGRVERNVIHDSNLSVTLGTEFRYDDTGNIGLDHTQARRYIENIGKFAVREGSEAVYAQATWSPIERLRLSWGLRGDYYHAGLDGKSAVGSSGSDSDHILSPKAGVAYAFNEHWELYGNWGRGFHSNDARGTINTTTPVPLLSVGTGYEGGVRYELGTLRLSVAYWWLNLSSELEFDGDSNSVEPGAASRRRGYELVGFWRPLNWLAFDAVYTGSRARSNDAGGPYLEGAVESAGELGFSIIHGPWEVSARLRYLGAYPLVSDNSQRAAADEELNIRSAYSMGSHLQLYGELLNALDHEGKDMIYWYAAHVPGIDPPGYEEEGRISRAEEPRTLRVGVRYTF